MEKLIEVDAEFIGSQQVTKKIIKLKQNAKNSNLNNFSKIVWTKLVYTSSEIVWTNLFVKLV